MKREYRGIPAAPGRGVGRVIHFDARAVDVRSAGSTTPPKEFERYEEAVEDVRARLAAERSSLPDSFAELREAHLLILQDEELKQTIAGRIQDGEDAATATSICFAEMERLVDMLDDPYFAARSADVRDVGTLLVSVLTGSSADHFLDRIAADSILCADDLAPSQVARLDQNSVRGIVLRRGSPLAHAAILARSLGIPMVCGAGDLLVEEGEGCLIDGEVGCVTVLGEEEFAALDASDAPASETKGVSSLGGVTMADGGTVSLLGNANNLADVERMRQSGMGGVGLLRTEFLFPRHLLPPRVEEQTALFADLIAAAPDGIFTVRALDAGGDKEIGWLSASRSPAIGGRRGVRLLLAEPELLRTQYRAFLRALVAAERPGIEPRFLLPMVTSAGEVVCVRALLDEVAAEEDMHVSAAPIVALGAMIEAPAAVFSAPEIAQVCGFLSIGTNDLAHALFATERAQSDPDNLADPLQPAVLRAIAMTSRAAQEQGIPLAVCGEVAGNPLAAPLLVGLGVSELSLRAPSAPLVHAALGRYTLEECKGIAESTLAAPDAASVQQLLAEFAAQ